MVNNSNINQYQISKTKESLNSENSLKNNSDGQQFYQYQQNKRKFKQ